MTTPILTALTQLLNESVYGGGHPEDDPSAMTVTADIDDEVTLPEMGTVWVEATGVTFTDDPDGFDRDVDWGDGFVVEYDEGVGDYNYDNQTPIADLSEADREALTQWLMDSKTDNARAATPAKPGQLGNDDPGDHEYR